MNKTYLITLTPMGKFFFGGDMTFSVNGIETDFTSYIIRSNKFPQQTSLLGMLRFLVLRNNGTVFDSSSQSITDRDGAKDLIGAKSFEMSGTENDFGVIKNISPCFVQIRKSDGEWIALSLETMASKIKVDLSKTTKAMRNGIEIDIPQSDYDPKKEYDVSFVYEGGKKSFKESDIFIPDVSNGINKDIKTGKTDDNALFKQVAYRMPEGFRFAFYAEVDLDCLINYKREIVSVGADNSQFMIEIKEEQQKKDKSEGNIVTLLSPAYLTEEDLKSVKYAITETIPFRCMKTNTDSVKSYNKRNQESGYSEKLSLYATGSVFYFNPGSDDALAFAEKLKAHADFYQIGYNHYQVTK